MGSKSVVTASSRSSARAAWAWVYEAEDVRLQRPIAIKLLPRELGQVREQARRRMRFSAALHNWRLANARAELRPYVRSELAAGRRPAAATPWLDLASIEGLAGRPERMRDSVEEALQLDRSILLELVSAMLLARVDPERAQAMLRGIEPRVERQAILSTVFVPATRAAIALTRGEAKEAIDHLVPGLLYERRFTTGTMLRGLAYRRAGMWKQAAGEFEKCVSRKYLVGAAWPAAQFHLAEAKAKLGDIAGARAAFEAFLASVPEADRDVPLVIEAKCQLTQPIQ